MSPVINLYPIVEITMFTNIFTNSMLDVGVPQSPGCFVLYTPTLSLVLFDYALVGQISHTNLLYVMPLNLYLVMSLYEKYIWCLFLLLYRLSPVLIIQIHWLRKYSIHLCTLGPALGVYILAFFLSLYLALNFLFR